MAALRSMPGVWAVLGSRLPPGMTRTPSFFQAGSDAWEWPWSSLMFVLAGWWPLSWPRHAPSIAAGRLAGNRPGRGATTSAVLREPLHDGRHLALEATGDED